ncbi:hypothetical protein IJV57_01060 [Candidatus Saccharibacteria bacterium]|nr:hypothetical protein [Candidatus Saccharibacteria bacterium]
MDIHNTSSTGSINIANAFDFEEFSKTEIGAAIAHLLEARCSTTESQAKLYDKFADAIVMLLTDSSEQTTEDASSPVNSDVLNPTGPYPKGKIDLEVSWPGMDELDHAREYSFQGVTAAEAEQHLSYAVRFATQEKATYLRIQLRRATKKSSVRKCWAGAEVSPNKAVAHFRKLVKVVLS